MKVKQRCTITLAKSRTVSPDVFVYRAAAYLELNQPYFAASDLIAAHGRTTVPQAYEKRVADQLEAMPEEATGYFASSDEHLDRLVEPRLGAGVVHKTAGAKGRGFFASETLKPGSVVLKSTPAWLACPLKEEHCSNCGGKITGRLVPCRNSDCHEEYCSRDCRHAAAKYHNAVCTNTKFQALELEVYSKLSTASSTSERNTAALHLMLLRIIAYALTNHMIPSVVPELRSLSGRLDFSPRVLADETLAFYKRVAEITKTHTSMSFEDFCCAMSKITANAFHDTTFIQMHVQRSMLNHSCDPNCMAVGNEIVTTRTAKPGEELCISYYPQLNDLPKDERKAELLRRGLECQCALCV